MLIGSIGLKVGFAPVVIIGDFKCDKWSMTEVPVVIVGDLIVISMTDKMHQAVTMCYTRITFLADDLPVLSGPGSKFLQWKEPNQTVPEFDTSTDDQRMVKEFQKVRSTISTHTFKALSLILVSILEKSKYQNLNSGISKFQSMLDHNLIKVYLTIFKPRKRT